MPVTRDVLGGLCEGVHNTTVLRRWICLYARSTKERHLAKAKFDVMMSISCIDPTGTPSVSPISGLSGPQAQPKVKSKACTPGVKLKFNWPVWSALPENKV
jgi:hypothetical protein